MGYIEVRTGVRGEKTFKAQIRRKGHPAITQTFTRKSDAAQWIQDTESNLRSGEFLPANEAKRHTLSETIDRYIADRFPDRKLYAQRIAKLEWFRKEIGCKRLSDVTPVVIAECRQKLKAEKVRGKGRCGPTCNRFCSQLSSVFEFAKDTLYWCKRNPVREVKWEKEHDGVIRFLSDDEKKRLLEACEKDEQRMILPIVVLALSTGMRKEEVRRVKWLDVDLERGAIILPKERTKTRTARRVPLRGKALQLLKELKEHQQSSKVVRLHSYVFPNPTGERPFDFRETWDRVRIRAELQNFRFHDLRHSCASFLAMNGASLLEIAEVLGHKTLAMVKRYSHLAESHTAGVVERMNEKIFGGTNG